MVTIGIAGYWQADLAKLTLPRYYLRGLGISDMHRAGIAFLCASAWLCPNAATAADAPNCNLKLVNTVPITMAYGGVRPLVAVTINGVQKQFLLDTGGYAIQISAKAAEQLNLPQVESNITLLDLAGNASTTAARIDTLMLGRLQDKNTTLPIMSGSSSKSTGDALGG